jgi:hypothetical protein
MSEREEFTGTLEELKEFLQAEYAKVNRETTPASKLAEVDASYNANMALLQSQIDEQNS